ncbi:unnamed protein product [Kuraishia capsulata CBS 1993]|uniref:CN hydrolase domain-containing protein n=1 Tax=Kuraishia capsulata CBS 1993 TaxID=1382522 RepID=W6MVX7_9ASCO|nr:uncharacterized protein KUCA_T00002613001 [Kuraishia capsulata CBS 1993]CDK26640.1 unnamed protein product [Kuraishia capsulata CBS 1993]
MVLVAVGQMCSSSSLVENAVSAVRLITRAVSLNCKVLFLPEAADYIARNAAHSKEIVKPVTESPFIIEIQKTLKKFHAEGKSIFVSVGVHEPSETSDRVKNTLLWISDKGKIEQRYQKVHLFDVEIKNGPILKESASVEPGNEVLKPFETPAGKLGSAICYDIRFPEIALRLRTLGAEIIQFPSAFTMRTGVAHWALLGRARAVDTQCYVVMAAQSGSHNTSADKPLAEGETATKRESYGHSMIIDPWGTVLAECSDILPGKEDICLADIDLERLESFRQNIPLWTQRRPDVFGYDV